MSLWDVTMLSVTRIARLDYKARKTYKKKLEYRQYGGGPVRAIIARKMVLGVRKLFQYVPPPRGRSSAKFSWWFATKVINIAVSYIHNNNKNVLHMMVLIKRFTNFITCKKQLVKVTKL